MQFLSSIHAFKSEDYNFHCILFTNTARYQLFGINPYSILVLKNFVMSCFYFRIMSIMIWLIAPFCITCLFTGTVYGHIPTLSLRDFSMLSHQICFVIIFDPPCDSSLSKLTANLSQAWKHIQSIQFYRFTLDDYMQNGDNGIIDIDPPLTFVETCGPAIVIPKMVKDRTCLMHSINKVEKRSAKIIPNSGENVVDFINNICGTFLTKNGDLNATGKRIEALKKNLHNVESKKVTLHELNRQCASPDLKYFFYSGICRTVQENCYKDNLSSECTTKQNTFISLEQCEEMDKLPNKQEFISEYLFRSKPVIFRKAVHHWPAFRKWTMDFFMQSYSDVSVHMKLSPTVEFEGVESETLWNNSANFTIPTAIKQALDNPDLVTVRPAGVEMKFKDFLNLINETTNATNKVFAYLEYTSMRSYFAGLENDVNEMPFVKNILNLNHLNIWMSDGNTLGKLHFDEYDNFLCQIRGKKQLILFDPHQSSRLYEGHILEAMFSYRNGTFYRDKLLKSTSMTMSPVDITLPDFEKFPFAKNAVPLNCTISEGDVLFLPSFWWHEVQSYPNEVEHQNIAVNFWYEPFWKKEFPCRFCELSFLTANLCLPLNPLRFKYFCQKSVALHRFYYSDRLALYSRTATQTKEGVCQKSESVSGPCICSKNMWICEKPKLQIKLPPGASFVDEEHSVLHSVSLSLPKRFLGRPRSSRHGHSIYYSERSTSTLMMKKLIVALKIAICCVFVINNFIAVWMLSNDCTEKFANLSNYTKILNVEMGKTDAYLNILMQILENLNASSEICI
ncbi:JmjC domain-containing protein 7 [Trichinella papuae]|uniref:JmjC domain-containing protein 7 n=1 Tax=Trichinella papuae TaxID=268474 RepID=A0A0V1MEM1_9BILA|nr:JmjC domain-containing protein 7 [Trichinella papuae]